ncbi:VOC family protein, partial [Myxococcota bacterium]|nr:VOC family protein [Myxococcota bacterium]
KGPVEAPPERTAIYTHPRDTFGILEFMAPRVPGGHGGQASADDALGDCYDPRLLGSYSPDFWRFEHPMKIQRSHMTVLVRDMGAARALYVDLLEGDPLHEDKHTCHDTHSLFVALGSDPVVVELARPLTHESSEARELEKNGEMLYSVTFQVSDLEAAEAHLRDCGLEPTTRQGGFAELGPDQALGAVFAFTAREVPNDPRTRD